jgi:hypothetical protein
VKRPTEAQRRAVDVDLDNEIVASGTDHELADEHGVAPAHLRECRRARRRALETVEIESRARMLAKELGFEDRPLADTILEALEHLLFEARVMRDPQYVRDLLDADRRRRRRAAQRAARRAGRRAA